MRGYRWALLLASASLAVSACGTGPGAASVSPGQRIEVVAAWTGAEAQDFGRVLAGFSAATGVAVTYTPAGPAGVPAEVDQRIASRHLPDVAFLPQPGALGYYAGRGLLVPLDSATATEVSRNYAPTWRRLGSYAGRLYGVWFKAANKSLVWYNVGVFERAGVVPPGDLDGLLALARRLSASGMPAFAVGGADPWTLTDWFENLYLRYAGPAAYDRLADHRVAWTDPTVEATLRLMSEVLSPDLLAGGADGALHATFPDSVEEVFGQPPVAAMTSEGDFVAGVAASGTRSELGVDVDNFPFPAVGAAAPGVVAGGDVAVLLRDSPGGRALLRYLATPGAAVPWASRGGFISPNVGLDPAAYPDAITRAEARSLLDAGDSFRFDLSDLQPPAFGSTPSAGMQHELAAFLLNRDVDGTAARLEADARAAFGR